jgi:glycosyltransferase involved in cell wall biosynthesis
MKVLALIEGPNYVCYRYRIEAFAWALAERGWTLDVVPLERRTLGRTGQLRAAGQADVVILQRKLLPLWQLAILRRAARRLIYDVDDALYQRDSYSRKGPTASWVRQAHFWATVYAADAVTAGNEYLTQRAAAYVGPQRVHAIPTCVDPRLYPTARHERAGSAAKLVWIGQPSTLPSLDRVQPHLAAAARRLPGLQLRVISNRFPNVAGIRVLPCRWSAATETAALAEADVGINYLPDDPWSRGKCGLKVLQYMAAGLPVVANPVGMNREMVVHGRTGLLASTPDEWAAAIERLALDPPLRQQMGSAGRRLVEDRFNVASWGPRFARLVNNVARGRPADWQPVVPSGQDGPAERVCDPEEAAAPWPG